MKDEHDLLPQVQQPSRLNQEIKKRLNETLIIISIWQSLVLIFHKSKFSLVLLNVQNKIDELITEYKRVITKTLPSKVQVNILDSFVSPADL